MGMIFSGFVFVLVVAIATDFRVLNALICLFKSLTHRVFASDATGSQRNPK